MTPLQIALITVAVLVFVTAIITYFIRGNYYEQIDALDQQKNELLKKAPHEELKEVRELSLAGRSLELREKFEADWNRIKSFKYPELENYLFAAEQATDRYRLNESRKIQGYAKESINEISRDIEELTQSLSEMIEREQANLNKIDTIKKRYHEVRKSLLAYSFSFGPASETFEEKLSTMEEDFTDFSESTLSGDHEEANKIIERLAQNIQAMEEQMEVIPPLLTKLNTEYEEDIDDLLQGYEQMSEHNYLFPEDNILENIEQLTEQKDDILENIRLLELEQASAETERLAENIDELYARMEAEISAQPKVFSLLDDVKEGIYVVQEEVKQLTGIEQRLAQSYILMYDEEGTLHSIDNATAEALEEYKILAERITENKLPYSVAKTKLTYLFNELSQLNKELKEIAKNLRSYRKEELHFKKEMVAMEQAMYDMKRALEHERLPGLPDDYLDLFFSTTNRIETLAEELAQTKVLLSEVRKIHQITEEDVIQLSQATEELIFQVNLIERTSQRLYRFRDSHKGIPETIRYSESLFNEDYEYDTALRLLREKLENIAPGTYDKIVQNYEDEKNSN